MNGDQFIDGKADLYQSIFQHLEEPIFFFDCRGKLIVWNHTAEELARPKPLPGLGEELSGFLRSSEIKREVERSLETNDGKIEFQLQMSKISTNGQEGVLVRLQDISTRKKAEARIHYLSYYDALTGLYNRSFFEVELKRLDTKRQLPLTVIMGDLNGLRLVNDTFGHEAGDKLLCQLAQAFRKALRREDIVARWGGDQFVILLHRTSSEVANQLCQRIRQTCREQGPDPIELSISLGTATKEVVELDVQSILRVAEDRMYASKQQESQSVSGGIISSLERSLWESKSETEEHAERLKRISQQLGRVLQLPGYQIDELALLALLHDIGKVVIPPQILAKPERLSPEEWETVKRHPQNGYRIATSSTEILLIAEAILAHHEHWDGSGYPRGLKGEEIPILSRILAIVDAYDVMTEGRPYQSAISHQAALTELQRCAGSQFDPGLVQTFCRMAETSF